MANYGKHLPTDRGARILEIGPGCGEVCELLADDLGYANYVGVDISADYHQQSPELVKARIRVEPDIPGYLRTVLGQFDACLIMQCLEHVTKAEQKPLLTAIHGCLRPGGLLIVEVPNIANMFLGPYYRYSDTTHEISFTDCSLEWTLRHGGFRPGDIEVRPTRVPLVSPARYVQFALQWLLDGLQRLLIFPYQPSGRLITSQFLSAIARKHSDTP